MKIAPFATAVLTFAALSAAQAQTPTPTPTPTPAQATLQRDVNQQQRIENGLQSGRITTREAGLLERDEARIDRLQAKDMKDGQLSAAERRQLRAAQNKASRDIKTAETNGINGNPLSASSQRMQADVQRDIHQERRIASGLKQGSLDTAAAGRLERGQAHDDALQARAAADGHVGAGEQRHLQAAENKQSARIHAAKHKPA